MGTRALFSAAGAGLALIGLSCSWLNTIDACDEDPTEVRINQRGDQSEFTNSPQAAAALLDSNRLWVAFVAQPVDATASEVRLASLNAITGERTLACGDQFELTVSDPSTLAYAASVAPVDLLVAGQAAKGALAWMEGKVETRARLRFFDGATCGLGNPFYVYDGTQLTSGPSIAWSPTKHALLAAFHDTHKVFFTWVTDTTPPAPQQLSEAFSVLGLTATSIAPNGRGIVGWAEYADVTSLTESRPKFRVALLGPDGAVMAGPNGAAEPFTVEFPAAFEKGTAGLTVASRDDRHAIALSLATSELAREVVYVTEISAVDGHTLVPPYRVDPDTGGAHFYPSLAYAPEGSLVVAWQTADRAGTVARLFDDRGRPRFNAVSCDDAPFPVGARATEAMQGRPSILFTEGRLWIAHPGQPGYDSVAMGAVGWRMEWSKLWPAR
ncbi:MAG: hypothetical protein HYZ29_07075 [Myxococcales bacterium]|nr:hypothetical protein [Myxococcales bacterium]